MPRLRITLLLVAIMLCGTGAARADERLAAAEQLLLKGNYEEAAEAFAKLQEELPVQAALGLARAHAERGQLTEAAKILDAAIRQHADAAELHSELAGLHLRRGDHAAAAAAGDAALRLAPDQPHARWLQSETFRLAGKVEEASQAYQWFADEWDRRGREIASPRDIHWLGLGLAQHARWNRDKTRFPQLVGDLYPRALELDPNFWPAHDEVGRLLAEKFNEADAAEAFADALRINARAADVHAAVAQLAVGQFELDEARQHVARALAADPKCLPALWAKADVQFAALRPDRALTILEDAKRLNPYDEQTLGRLAAAHQLQPRDDGEAASATGRTLLQEVQSRNAACGEFHAAWANALELSRRYGAAAEQFAAAIDRLPQLTGARGQLGLIHMRLGQEAEARKLLEESFAIDPYNLRVKNQLEVLDLLDQYATIETEHFFVRFDKEHDERLGRCLAEYAETVYEELSAAFGYELPRRAALEIFSPAGGHSGAEWFGARMVGLPNIHTIAACGGNIVAMISPGDGGDRRRINWADVMRHELVHLFNVQQTDYSVPHWFTEGCAVWLEGRPRRDEWNRLLATRGPKGELFDLDAINQAFIRPRSGDDWQLAYCQAELYAECLLQEYGDDALAKMLAAYADNRSTAEALQHAFGVTQKKFEAAYQKHLSATLAELLARRAYKPAPQLAELEQQFAAAPEDPQVAAALAMLHFRRGDHAEAGRLAAKTLAINGDHAMGRLVRAKLLLRIGDEQAALDLLAPVVAAEEPPAEAIELAAGLHARRGELDEATRWYERGARQEPHALSWTKARAAMAVKQGDDERAAPLLAEVAAAEADNLIVRKKLLQLAVAREYASETARWADEVLHIDVHDVIAHRQLADALDRLNQPRRAAEHRKMAAMQP